MKYLILLVLFVVISAAKAQLVPGSFEQISYLVTFGPQSHPSWGDDDHTQIFFFIVPKSFTKPVYIRILDPDVGGALDENNRGFNTKTKFSVYGGKGCHSNPDAKKIDPVGEFRSGTLMASKTFGNEARYDNQWYSMGPFNPLEGEVAPELGGNIIKVIVEGVSGNDGNLYRFFLSTKYDDNLEVEGSNAFTYEYSIRIPEPKGSVSHLYPFIDKDVVSVTQHNFDLDKEADVLIYSVAKNRQIGEVSRNDGWSKSKHDITEEEQNTTIDVQIIKNKYSRNDMVAYITNQYDEAIPYFSNPIGGPPRYKYKVDVQFKSKKAKN